MANANIDLMLASPEWVMLALVSVVLVVDLFLKQEQRSVTYWLSQLSLVITAVTVVCTQWGVTATTFDEHYIVDPMAALMKVALLGLVVISFAYTRDYLKDRELFKGEFYLLGLFGAMGMMVMASAGSMITVYLGLELLSLSLYAMVAFNRDNGDASEAAMKYFVLGAIASGMLLYGMSMVYGMTNAVTISDIAAAIATGENNIVLLFGLTFIVIGVAFKFGAVPFHMWVPDVYQGAPTVVALYLSTAPKIASVALFVRLMIGAMDGLAEQWSQMMIMLVVASLAIGNLFALVQTNIKRLFAYSTVSHVGFMLLALATGTKDGQSAAVFYAISYGLMSAASFGLLIYLSNKGYEAENISDFAGLGKKSPAYALILLAVMASLAGIPGFVGFYSKVLVIESALSAGLVEISIVAVLFAVVGAFYYLRVLKVAFFDEPKEDGPVPTSGFEVKALLAANGVAIVALGIFPQALIALCYSLFV